MSKKNEAAYDPQGMTKNVVPKKSKKKHAKKDRVWIRKADGVYLHKPSGFYYWRPWRLLNEKMTRTWESLDTSNLTIAKERYSRLRYPADGKAPVPSNGPQATQQSAAVTMGQVIRRYIKDGYPDKHKATSAGSAARHPMLPRRCLSQQLKEAQDHWVFLPRPIGEGVC